MTVARFNRYHDLIRVHTAADQLRAIEACGAPYREEASAHELIHAYLNEIDPTAGVEVITLSSGRKNS